MKRITAVTLILLASLMVAPVSYAKSPHESQYGDPTLIVERDKAEQVHTLGPIPLTGQELGSLIVAGFLMVGSGLALKLAVKLPKDSE